MFKELQDEYAGLPLWVWIVGGAAVFGIAYHFFSNKQANTAQANTTGNNPVTLDQAGLAGPATVAGTPPQDSWPYNQLGSMQANATANTGLNYFNPQASNFVA